MKHIFLAVALLFSAHFARSAPIGAEVQSSNYDQVRGITTVRIVNTSQKLITAIGVSLRLAHPDGTISITHYGGDFLPFMAYAAASGIPQQSNGGLAPEAVFAMEVPSGQQLVQATSATVEVVTYDDATADVLNESVFRSFTLGRKGRMLGLQRALELLQKALADPNDPHPSITVTAQLKALAAQNDKNPPTGGGEAFEGLGLREAATDISNAPKSPSGRSQEEDDYLRALIKTHGNRISFSLPHTQITKPVRP